MSYETIQVGREGKVAVITLNRPPVNALNTQLYRELASALQKLASDKDVGAVLLAGGEKAFAAGADVSEMAGLSPVGAHAFCRNAANTQKLLEDFPKPTVAALAGLVLGGGAELTYCCDFRLAAENAKFGQPEINLGIIPGGGGTQRLPRLIGLARAKELLLLGDIIDAATALNYGLVHRVLPVAELLKEAQALAAKLAQKPAVAMATLKRVMRLGLAMDLDTGLQVETESFAVNFSSEDAREGLQAFMAKRQPAFRGR